MTFVCPSYWLAETFYSYGGHGKIAWKTQFSVINDEYGTGIF